MGNWLKVQIFGPTSPEILEQKFEAGVTDSAFCVYFPSGFDIVVYHITPQKILLYLAKTIVFPGIHCFSC